MKLGKRERAARRVRLLEERAIDARNARVDMSPIRTSLQDMFPKQNGNGRPKAFYSANVARSIAMRNRGYKV